MKKKKIIGILVIVFILFIGMFCGCYVINKLENKFTNYDNQINSLASKTDYLEQKLNQSLDYYEYNTEYKDDAYNYFAIGNSLTLITSEWGRGICSTQPDNDYFHLVTKALESKYGEVVAYPYNFAMWELADNRDSVLDVLDIYLNEKLNLVSIQLGENCGTKTKTYEEDIESLIKYVKNKCPNATIVIVGDWWTADRNEMRKVAANNQDVLFADLSEIMQDPKYQAKAGTICYTEDGGTIKVSKNASTHPGDLGMEYIANKIMAVLKLK